MSKRTFIIIGDVTNLATIRDSLTEDVCGILLHVNSPESEVRKSSVWDAAFHDRLFTFESLDRASAEIPDPEQWPLYERCLRAVLADARVHYLAMRSFFDSALNNTTRIERIVVNTLSIIRRVRPEQLVASSTPHSVQAWILARCFEELGLPVYILERTPINNRAWIYHGLDGQKVVPRTSETGPGALTPYTQSQVHEQVSSKAGARDARGFYVSRMDLASVKGANSNKWWSYRREMPHVFVGRLLSLPIRLASSYLKRRLFRSYQALATETLPDTPFVIYFMHYQPERSSLPEGLFHTQQLIALRQLAWTLPKGWTLLVREHPSMWLLPLDLTVRTADYYEQIAALPNTRLCSMDVDTFELIDRSAVVSTLTGSVGFQALLRGKPVFVFGLPAYKDHPACFNVATTTELAQAFEQAQSPELRARFSEPELERYLLWVERNSVVADPAETDWLAARLKNFTELYRQLLSGRFYS